jgi:type VI secretion system protein ImpA
MRFSAEDLAQPISEDLPCGEDLEYDLDFQKMETMMQSSAEQEFGDTVIAASGPDWKGVRELTGDLLGRTRDIRVLTYAALADLHLSGLGAFSESLEALNICLENFWGGIYPLLDIDDDNDATERFNNLQILNDHQLVCVGLENAPLVEIRGLGGFSLRAIELAEGKGSPVGDEVVHEVSLIQGAFGDADAEALTALAEGLDGSVTQLNRTAELWDQLAPEAAQLSFDGTLRVLNDIHQAISKYAPAAAAAVFEEGEDDGESVKAPPASGAINDHADVVRMLDKICEYYSVNEPSSPIPLLLRRAQRLVSKSFFEILEDVAPDSVPQAQVIRGYTAPQE